MQNLKNIKLASAGILLSALAFGQTGFAADWGVSVAHNNPLGSGLGVNLLIAGENLALEVGIGGVGLGLGESRSSVTLGGDIDVKYLFGKTWSPYVEAGLKLGFGAGVGDGGGLGLSAGSPFAGAGLMYRGDTLFAYGAGGFSFRSQTWAPVFGIGVKL